MSFLCSYCESILNTGASFCAVCSRAVPNEGHDGKLAVKHRTRLTNQTLRLNQIELPKKISYAKLRKDFSQIRSIRNTVIDMYPFVLVGCCAVFLFNNFKCGSLLINKVPILKAYFSNNDSYTPNNKLNSNKLNSDKLSKKKLKKGKIKFKKSN